MRHYYLVSFHGLRKSDNAQSTNHRVLDVSTKQITKMMLNALIDHMKNAMPGFDFVILGISYLGEMSAEQFNEGVSSENSISIRQQRW